MALEGLTVRKAQQAGAVSDFRRNLFPWTNRLIVGDQRKPASEPGLVGRIGEAQEVRGAIGEAVTPTMNGLQDSVRDCHRAPASLLPSTRFPLARDSQRAHPHKQQCRENQLSRKQARKRNVQQESTPKGCSHRNSQKEQGGHQACNLMNNLELRSGGSRCATRAAPAGCPQAHRGFSFDRGLAASGRTLPMALDARLDDYIRAGSMSAKAQTTHLDW